MSYYPPPGYYPPPQPPYPPYPQYSGCLKFALYALSFFIPFPVGFILGLVFMFRNDPESKSLGTACLVISIVSIVLSCCVGGIFAVSSGLLSALLENTGGY